MRKLTGAILLSMALGILPWWSGNASAAEFAVPHTFQGGGMVSADELNERFDNLELQRKNFVAADLVGTWVCPVANTSISGAGWTLLSDGITYTGAATLTFTLSGGILYFSNTGAFIGNTSTNVPTQIIHENVLTGLGSIRKISNTRFEFSYVPTMGAAWAHCDKQNVPPLKPSGLAASASGASVTLTWTDNSSDETGFDIVRKDTASGSWSVVGSVAANIVTYVNTSVSAGTHWYRVVAKNANGSSLGSNVVKVTN